ncbi:MAG: hypothetical protein AAF620_15140 [Bacteroidota bacterium]
MHYRTQNNKDATYFSFSSVESILFTITSAYCFDGTWGASYIFFGGIK